jgi:hypothetical protein
MNAQEATAEVFLTAFRALPKKEQKFIVEKLLNDEEFMEDLTDIVIFEQRKNEPSRSINEYIASRKKS